MVEALWFWHRTTWFDSLSWFGPVVTTGTCVCKRTTYVSYIKNGTIETNIIIRIAITISLVAGTCNSALD